MNIHLGELKEGQIFEWENGFYVKLSHRVLDDETKWHVAVAGSGRGWIWMNTKVALNELRGDPIDEVTMKAVFARRDAQG